MKVLLDTNVVIQREQDRALDENLAGLLSTLAGEHVQLVIHPRSIQDVERDQDVSRRKVLLSKLAAFGILEDPLDYRQDEDLVRKAGPPQSTRDEVRLSLLFSLRRDAAAFLVTEDPDLHERARAIGLADRALTVLEGCNVWRKRKEPPLPEVLSLQNVPADTVDLCDPIMESLLKDYSEFREWWAKISRQGRPVWISRRQDSRHLGGLMVVKAEDETIVCTPPLPARPRLKICTLKVAETGRKLGEMFLKLAFHDAARQEVEEVYLTHFEGDRDHLVSLIEDFGFQRIGTNARGEGVFVKPMKPCLPVPEDLVSFAKRFYPFACDGEAVRKFVVPIRPEFHERLFPEWRAPQSRLPLTGVPQPVEGNTIRKAYFTRSIIGRIRPGDMLLFYRSKDAKALTSIGVVEDVHPGLQDPRGMLSLAEKRTVYSIHELEEMAKPRGATLILFLFQSYIIPSIPLKSLLKSGILSAAPQSIVELPHDRYVAIKELGGGFNAYLVGHPSAPR